MTAILYLNDLPLECGAATVFPLADAESTDPRLLASKRLLMDEICHTRGSAYYSGGMGASFPIFVGSKAVRNVAGSYAAGRLNLSSSEKIFAIVVYVWIGFP